MKITEIHEYARKLLDAHGDNAEVEAAQKARILKKEGQRKQAEDWTKIREAIHEMRGPRAS